jgi:polyphosphate kinase
MRIGKMPVPRVAHVQAREVMSTAVAKTNVAEEPSAGVGLLPKEGAQEARLSDPENFINRELSWLEFNRRVLEEAQDPTQPLIERVKFLTIVSSNLDEFFEIRVAGIKQQIKSETSDIGPDGLSPTDTFDRIQKTVRQLVATQYALWKNELLPELAKNGIYVREMAELSPKRAAWAHRYFQQEVLPMLTPLAVDASHPFPHLLNRSHNLLVRAKLQRGGEPMHAIVQVPRAVSRLILLPRGKSADEPWEYIYLASLIRQHIGELFPGLILDEVHAFRVTRNSDLYIDEEEAENLLRSIEQELRRSSRGNAVRLEVEADCPKDVLELLLRFFDLTGADAYKLDGPLSMTHLMPLVTNDAFAKLKDRPFQPARDPALPPHVDFFEVLRRQDVLLHHPYDSFDQIVEWIEAAACDPQVLAIKITLYRTSGDSPIVEALIEAANAGKQVTAIVELRARFDEASNIRWARRLEEVGAHVIYGVVGLKTHCKGRIVAKLNALVDQEIIEKLYEASCADVTIDLIVRGICSLRPKMPGLSDNIRVISIVGRFLEHSRIFYFENAGQPKVFLSSADWMPRNFYRRIELAFPVENPALRDQIINEVLPSFLHDRVKARELQPDGKYRRLKPEGTEPRAQAQWHFREVSRERAEKMTKSKKKLRADKLVPITVVTEAPSTNPEADSGQRSAPTDPTPPVSPTSATTRKQS